jgi:hypothetical protein
MPTVTVDADDLEALLFASGGIKDLEGGIKAMENLLAGRKNNPMVRSAAGKLGAAHDRLSAAWRRANREAEWPAKLVTQADLAGLQALFTDRFGKIHDFAVLDHYPQRLAQELLLVESGPLWEGYRIDWPSPAEPEFRTSGAGVRYGARLTHYGKQVLGATQQAPREALDHDVARAAIAPPD